jgi:phage terminase large subunit-like protein
MLDLASHLAAELECGWSSLARPSQLPPPGDWTIWALVMGRGAGKTRAGGEWVRSLVESGEGTRIAIISATAADGRDIVVEGESSILAISPDWNRPAFEPSKRRLTWPNGAIASLFSSEEPERLRGQQFTHAWADELGSWQHQEATFDQLMFCLRLGKRPRCCITTTPRPTKVLKNLFERNGKDVIIVRESSYANRANLPPSFFADIITKYEGTRLGRQELNAELLLDTPGALWSMDLIEELRVARNQVPEFNRVVVAIDPAVSCGENADETGIIVAALGTNQHGYVLEDASGRYQPNDWAKKAISLYYKYAADRIVAETNQGGLMVEATLRAVDANVSFRDVHARKGKLLRAEPISALYEQGRVHHVGAFPQLEDQMCSYAGGGDSPDRLDALVYCLTELMSASQTTGIIDFYRSLVEEERQRADAAIPGSAAAMAEAATVMFLVPEGVSNFFAMSGRQICVGTDRLVKVSARDAAPLRQLGWQEIEAIGARNA